MMLVTCTRSPPSCSARLPQKSSAATTFSLPPEPAELEPDPQPARSATTRATGARAKARARGRGADIESPCRGEVGMRRGGFVLPLRHKPAPQGEAISLY